jgi:hypothetical protein
MVCQGNRLLIGSNAVTENISLLKLRDSAAGLWRKRLMENIIGKPLYPSASCGAVAYSPPKPTMPLIRERILGSFSRYPAAKNALGKKPISRPTLISVSNVEAELAEVRNAWERY